jgi:hypothetical protein
MRRLNADPEFKAAHVERMRQRLIQLTGGVQICDPVERQLLVLVREIADKSHDASSDIGSHWVAINKFLETNDPSHLEPFVGLGLRDTRKRFWLFETRPNVLRKLDSAGELSVVELYRQTVQ